MAANNKNIIHRFAFVAFILILLNVFVIIKAAWLMTVDRQYYKEFAKQYIGDTVSINAMRGNIISADGKLMASSIPEYRIYLDTHADTDTCRRRNTKQLLLKNLGSISKGLNKLFPDVSAAAFKTKLLNAILAKDKNYLIYPKRISFMQLQEVKKLPVFCEPSRIGGLHEVVYNQRQRPFGSLASRTLGSMYPDAAMGAKNGLELSFDSVLKGKNGSMHIQKVLNKRLGITDIPPINGCDIETTINVDMQDICEKALIDKLKEINAISGVAVLMETNTGNIRAIVNMKKCEDGQYREVKNDAISNMMEPGSTFKTASIMVALEDGYITPDYMVDTGAGVRSMYGRNMTDWTLRSNRGGGFGVIDVTHILMYSSNIGVSTIIDKFYHNNPQKFIDGLKRMSLNQPLHLQLQGEGIPNIRGPRERYFPKTTLPWMSIGYETQIPPLNILTFYNAIANNGVMVRPKFVDKIMQKGEIIKTFPTEVINPKICSAKTLYQIREILKRVVMDEHGLGKPARSKHFATAGKTGTAQISQGAAGYKSGGTSYLVSFCGFFPADKPKYSCIVSIIIPGGHASGGLMSGSVFGKISDQVYARDLRLPIDYACDTINVMTPKIYNGDWNETKYVLDALKIPSNAKYYQKNTHVWCKGEINNSSILLTREKKSSGVPSVINMGAKDAVYLLTNVGLKVKISGTGKIASQSLQPGTKIIRGEQINLILK